MPRTPFACDLVLLCRHADFRTGRFVRHDVARRASSGKSRLLGDTHICDKIIFARGLGLLQPYLFARECSHLASADLVSCNRDALTSGGHIPRFRGPISVCFCLRRARCRLVGSFSSSVQNTQRVSTRCRGRGSDELGKDLPISCRHNAVENQIYHYWARDCVRSKDLYTQSGTAFFWEFPNERCGQCSTLDWVRIDCNSSCPKRFWRNRCLSLPCCLTHIADICFGWSISFRRRRACSGGGANRQSGRVPVPSTDRAHGFCIARGAVVLESNPPKNPSHYLPPFQKAAI